MYFAKMSSSVKHKHPSRDGVIRAATLYELLYSMKRLGTPVLWDVP